MIRRALPARGQVWSSDLAVSLLVFTIAALIAFTMVINTIDERDYDDVRGQAYGTAALLAGEGYPTHWSNETVIRAGLMSDNRLSLRKVNELSNMSRNQLRSALRVTDNVYIYFTNSSNDTVSVFGKCGVGDALVAAVQKNVTLPALALGSDTLITDNVDAVRGDLYGLSEYDVVIVEGQIITDLAAGEVARIFDTAAKRGMTFIVIGDPGTPLLGIDVNETGVDAVEVIAAEAALRLTPETLAVSGSIPTINAPNTTAVSNYRVIATGNGSVAIASWTYHDAQVWYIATATGTHADASALALTIGNATQSMIVVPRPTCDEPAVQGEQVVMHARTIPHHDELLTMRVLVWRE